MKKLFDELSLTCSKLTTKKYSTSFSLCILFLDGKIRNPIYAIYGFVRLADEIVDSFHDFDKENLLNDFISDTHKAIEQKISLNPVLNAFQETVHKYAIDTALIDTFLESMKMDLTNKNYNSEKYRQYIFGSAEAVGLMCLRVFLNGNDRQYEKLRPYAMTLGSAFQKVNFLRDLKADREILGRTYFPETDLSNFSEESKEKVESEIEKEFVEALAGIKKLPDSSRLAVYIAYYYYMNLFRKIKKLPPHRVLNERIRISNYRKILMLISCNFRYQFDLI